MKISSYLWAGDGNYWGSGLQSVIELYLNDRSYFVVGSSALVLKRKKVLLRHSTLRKNMAIDFAMKSSTSDASVRILDFISRDL